jgi:hypothetical protein
MLIQNYSRLVRRALGAMVVLVGLAQAPNAMASTIYTYSFIQTAFKYGPDPISGTVSGSFSGTLDSSGRIELATLTHFEIHGTDFVSPSFPELMFIGTHSAPDFFTYLPGDTGTFSFHLALNSSLPLPAEYCMGSAIFLICGGSGSARGVGTLGGNPVLISEAPPKLTLVATTPIPASLLLLGTALSGIAGLALARRQRSL